MPDHYSITLLHVSDMQFGRNHRFGNLATGDPDAECDTLFTRLDDDLRLLARTHDLKPQVIVVSGDLAEWGRKTEFEHAFDFLGRIASSLGVPRSHVVVVPGNHDVNRDLCASYFLECAGEEREPLLPYARKWDHFRAAFEAFYADVDGVGFSVEHPHGLWRFDDLRLVVAGLNSTIRESHRDEEHYGWVGERQLRWFADQLQRDIDRGWVRLGVVHHNVRHADVDDDENLRDAEDLEARLGASLNILLHGHTHKGKTHWLHSSLPVLSTGSAALDVGARPPEVPNQYQVIRLHQDRVERWTRRYAPQAKRWEGDTGSSPDGDAWRVIDKVDFAAVHGTFGPSANQSPQGIERPRDNKSAMHDRTDDGGRSGSRGGFLDRVAEVCELRHGNDGGQVRVERRIDDPDHEYLRVCIARDALVRSFPVAVAEAGVTAELIECFCAAVFEPYYWALDRSVRCEIVYGGDRAPEQLIERAAARNILLRSFVEAQGIIDFRGYTDRQTTRLGSDIVYPPGLYVPQRLEYEVGAQRVTTDDALAQLTGWLCEPRGRFALVLGDFGAGKTFLLRELARRMPVAIPHLVPVLVELRALEKAHTLEQLVAQHLAVAGERYIDLAAFPYMLREGRIALLFDGFDELAQRVTYRRATEHFETLVRAAGGNAKIVVTSRTQHFESDRQVKLAMMQRAEGVPTLSLCRLQPFDDVQIRAFLGRRLGDDDEARERYELIEEIEDLLGLSHNPRMLGFIAALPAQQLRDARERKGAITSAELYRLLIDQWLTYEAEKIVPRGAAPSLTKQQRLDAVTALAVRLWSKLERTIHVTELSAEVSAAAFGLSNEPTNGETDSDSVAHLVGSRTLLVRDEEGAFAFVHQSVMEWLVADHAARLLADDVDPASLGQRPLTKLMTDFLCDLADREQLLAWGRAATSGDGGPTAGENALLVLERLGKRVAGASLAGQHLAGRDLAARDFQGTDAAGADLTEARLAGSDLSDADLRGATLVRTDLDGAVLARASLDGADARGASLLATDLRGAVFGNASLRYARMTGAQIDRGALAACDTFGAAAPDMVVPTAMVPSAASPCVAVAYHPAGDLLASGHADGGVTLWDLATGRELRTLIGHEGGVNAVAFAPDADVLATAGDDGTVRLWDLTSGRALGTLTGHRGWVNAIAFAPHGRTLATAGDDGSVRLWDVATRHTRCTMDGHRGWVKALAFTPDASTLATAGYDGSVRLWDPDKGSQLSSLIGHPDWVNAVAFAPSARSLASAGRNGDIWLWDMAGQRSPRIITGHGHAVNAVGFAADGGSMATAGADGFVQVWDPATGNHRRTLNGHDGPVNAVAFAPDSASVATTGSDGSIRLWDPATGRNRRTLIGHRRWVKAVAFAPLARAVATARGDGSIGLWDPATGNALRTLTGHQGPLNALALARDGTILAGAGTDGSVRLWDPATGDELRTLTGHRGAVNAVAFAPGTGTLAAGGDDGTVRLWDPVSGRELGTLAGHQRWVTEVAFSPDASVLAAAGDGVIRLWDPRAGRELRTLTGHHGAVNAVAFAHDGLTIASAGHDASIRIWDPATEAELRSLTGHRGWVNAIAFAPDGLTIASAGEDGSVRMWDPATGHELRALIGHEGAVNSVAFAPDGDTLASVSNDSSTRLWDPASGALRATLMWAADGWIVYAPDGRYKLNGRVGIDEFWYAIGLCRFAVGELDAHLPEGTLTRIELDEPL